MTPHARVADWLARHHCRPNSDEHKVLTYLADVARPRHDARIAGVTFDMIARASGCCWKTVQRVVHRLEGVWIAIEARRGVAHVYRVLFDWIRPQVEGEQRAERERPTPREFAALETEPAPALDSIPVLRPWPNLDHHPRL